MLGYKAFNEDGTNRYGKVFEIGESYHVDGDILARFGKDGNGFYYCTKLADVFRFFAPDDVKVGVVEASGEIDSTIDEYYYYEIFACSDIKVIKYLTREEILNTIISEGRYSIDKAIATYNFIPEEKDILLDNSRGDYSLACSILWYCYDKKDIFQLDLDTRNRVVDFEYQKLDERLNKKKKTK